MGRPPKLNDVQKSEARKRRAEGATLKEPALSYNVARATIFPLGPVTVTTIVPLAYLPSFRLAGDGSSFGAVLAGMVLSGPWPSGPAWFVGMLLIFDGIAVALFGVSRLRDGTAIRRRLSGPAQCFGMLVALSAAVYIPLLFV
jgi:hypothetical protein